MLSDLQRRVDSSEKNEMDTQEHRRLLINMLEQVAPNRDVEALHVEPTANLEVLRSGPALDHQTENAAEGLRSITEGRLLTDEQSFGLEAIVLPRYRPVIDIIADNFNTPPSPWTHLGSGDAKSKLLAAIPSIGRVEVPGHPQLPYAGTGFVVGPDLLMTNRHVAEVFCTGLGLRGLAFRSGHRAGVDFAQEVVPRDPLFLEIHEVVLVHPHWDMAILRVSGITPSHPALRLSVAAPEDLADRDIAVIGYPAQDPRNDFSLQFQVFRGTFDVKRLQPGKLKQRARIVDSFGNDVYTVTHDASTLGGNSGSAVIDVATGEVVGLHFGGRYLKANYAVPTLELAKDRRVAELGMNFTGRVEPTQEWEEKWRAADGDEASQRPPRTDRPSGPPTQTTVASGVQLGSFTIPLQVSVSIGPVSLAAQTAAGGGPVSAGPLAAVDSREVPLKIPIIYDDLESRAGYDATFLELEDEDAIELPELTAAGQNVATTLDDGSIELKYHKFSIVMHKKRRLALVTAANVDWRDHKRKINGKKPSRTELTGIPKNFGEQWVTDPRIPDAHQLPDVFFTKDRGSFDKGHLVRRDDVCWGDSFEDIQMANGDTFHTTNCSPQVAGFNQANQGDLNWGDLENLVQKETKAERAIVLAGPIFSDDDPVFKGKDSHGTVQIKIPQKYWKIIVVRGDAGPEAYGFILEQDLGGVDWEFAVPTEWEPHTASVAEIEELLQGLVSLDSLKQFDQTESPLGRRLEESLAVAQLGKEC
jgi:endonuclease G